MFVRNNYDECLTNLACSIRKYFDLSYKHKTLPYINKILDSNKPKNVVTILLDGMGSNLMDALLDYESFLLEHRLKSITTVFPATTVAATTSITTGLNPVETAMLGWDMYYKGINKTITTFKDCEKSDPTETPLEEAKEYKEKHMITKTIMDEINEKGDYCAYTLMPMGDSAYSDIGEMFERIEMLCSMDGKKYIYAYSMEPDHTMHELGCRCTRVMEIMRDLDKRIEKLSHKVKDTVIFVVADHGHLNVENIFLDDYPELVSYLTQNTSLEPRAVNFFVKEGQRKKFRSLFNKLFHDDFWIYSKGTVIDAKLFGNGKENEIFRDCLGDYLAIGKTNKAIIYGGSQVLRSQHAGYTDDEIYVPLVVIKS